MAQSSKKLRTPLAWGLLALGFLAWPALQRAARVYATAMRYHSAEYLYMLGNGATHAVAVQTYERKAKIALHTWLRRQFGPRALWHYALLFLVCLIATHGQWLLALETVVGTTLAITLGALIGLRVMLLSARKHCFDNYGMPQQSEE